MNSAKSGIFEGMNHSALKSLCEEQGFQISILVTPGTFLIEGTPFLATNKLLPEKTQNLIIGMASVVLNQTIDDDFFYGFCQLREIALKALSPGINDPGTAIISMHALSSLILYRANHYPQQLIRDDNGNILIKDCSLNFEKIVLQSFDPIWDYGKNDRLMCQEFYQICSQLKSLTSNPVFQVLIERTALQMIALKSH
ncbi:DUF2254 family protein [Dyadobacter frigoris]|uniref:DUF2254 family protein n=1 Tax=Dyadobacter frigoris TaxID=2576211 RepID=UPI0025543127|nr:DUF2254 family protein [Dyadobacter frigoris]